VDAPLIPESVGGGDELCLSVAEDVYKALEAGTSYGVEGDGAVGVRHGGSKNGPGWMLCRCWKVAGYTPIRWK